MAHCILVEIGVHYNHCVSLSDPDLHCFPIWLKIVLTSGMLQVDRITSEGECSAYKIFSMKRVNAKVKHFGLKAKCSVSDQKRL